MNILLRTLIWLSVILFFVELCLRSTGSYAQLLYGLLWIERIIACVFTIEILVRLFGTSVYMIFLSKQLPVGDVILYERKNSGYFGRAMFWIDLLAILPFWVGFFVPVQALGWVRTLRVLRLAKLIRYNKHLQEIVHAFLLAWPKLQALMIANLIVVLFSAAVMYRAEPKTFDNNIGNALWYAAVTSTTIGYGEIVPVTPLGKILAVFLLFMPALWIFAGGVGIMGSAFLDGLDDGIDAKDTDSFKKIFGEV